MILSLTIIIALMIFPAGIGFLVLFHTFIRKKKSPVDSSNRLNHLRLVWFALTREDKFVELFPWLKQDEWDNLQS